ncbi:MAG: bifunctional riboflavin kinase/FAD synthetase [Rhodospirillales bacterium]|nr:bifunctional riboflavin kinase/FAD synthetase [Alphaproteobacteria bacterium]MCB9986354.1 bifunctional riboflavin kinase/FAD synthetase [Rhodospirillales bacterium]USO07097.1 MAG: bifunctional riboflavin kinase/FAD synthetase [Rhodospirillales bacterium]
MNDTPPRPVVAIGNFDGVHLGHAALLARARAIADAQGRPLVAVTFEPHPRAFFNPDAPPFRLTPETVKARRLKELDVDEVQILDFNAIMAGLSAAQFVDMIVVGHLDAAHVVVGSDFHFGKGRAGHVDTLQADGRFQVTAVTLEAAGDAPVSSTRIRAALKEGDIAAANAMLGWAWEIEGPVVHGDARGRELGYPTANMPLGETCVPAHGVYAARVLIDGEWRMGAANIGIRPMFATPEPLLEVYVLDFSGDLYGQTLRVQPVRKLRDEAKFDTLDALKAQIAQDVARAREILGVAMAGMESGR